MQGESFMDGISSKKLMFIKLLIAFLCLYEIVIAADITSVNNSFPIGLLRIRNASNSTVRGCGKPISEYMSTEGCLSGISSDVFIDQLHHICQPRNITRTGQTAVVQAAIFRIVLFIGLIRIILFIHERFHHYSMKTIITYIHHQDGEK
jgi:hypothetical protein